MCSECIISKLGNRCGFFKICSTIGSCSLIKQVICKFVTGFINLINMNLIVTSEECDDQCFDANC